jgi:hypothetical protein
MGPSFVFLLLPAGGVSGTHIYEELKRDLDFWFPDHGGLAVSKDTHVFTLRPGQSMDVGVYMIRNPGAFRLPKTLDEVLWNSWNWGRATK